MRMVTLVALNTTVFCLSVLFVSANADRAQGRTEQLASALAGRIQNTIANAKVRISVDGRKAIDDLATTGAKRLVTDESESNLRRANENADAIGRKLASMAEEKQTSVTAETVKTAKSSLCPIYPFC